MSSPDWWYITYRARSGRTVRVEALSGQAARTIACRLADKHQTIVHVEHDGDHFEVKPGEENPLGGWLPFGLAVLGGGVLGYFFYRTQVAAQALATQNAQLMAQVASDQTQIGSALQAQTAGK